MENKITALAEKNNWQISRNLKSIIHAKLMMFGETEWHRCPCDGNNPLRYCGGPKCAEDISEKGKCHCNLFLRKN